MELGKKGNITDQVMKDKANSEKAKIQELSIYDQALAKYNTDIKDEDIMGIMTAFSRDGKNHTVKEASYLRYTKRTLRFYPVRVFFQKLLGRGKGAVRKVIKPHGR